PSTHGTAPHWLARLPKPVIWFHWPLVPEEAPGWARGTSLSTSMVPATITPAPSAAALKLLAPNQVAPPAVVKAAPPAVTHIAAAITAIISTLRAALPCTEWFTTRNWAPALGRSLFQSACGTSWPCGSRITRSSWYGLPPVA